MERGGGFFGRRRSEAERRKILARAAGLGIWGLTTAQKCELADRVNGIGEGSPGCFGITAGTRDAP